MDVDLIFRIAAVGILVAVLGQLLSRSGREEQALMTTLAGLIVVLMLIVQEIDRLFTMMKNVFGADFSIFRCLYIGISRYHF